MSCRASTSTRRPSSRRRTSATRACRLLAGALDASSSAAPSELISALHESSNSVGRSRRRRRAWPSAVNGSGDGGGGGSGGDGFARRAAAAGVAAWLGGAATLGGGPGGFGPPPALAALDKRTIGEITTSGIVFKDKLLIDAFADPKVEGVSLYLSDFTKPITDRMSKDFFSDPSNADLECVRTGPVKLADGVSTAKDGEEVFSEARSLMFKTLKVRRVYDQKTGTLVYAAYSERANKNDDDNKSRFSSALCAIHVD